MDDREQDRDGEKAFRTEFEPQTQRPLGPRRDQDPDEAYDPYDWHNLVQPKLAGDAYYQSLVPAQGQFASSGATTPHMVQTSVIGALPASGGPAPLQSPEQLESTGVKAGEFLELELEISVPTSVPGLNIVVGGAAELTVYESGDKKLEVTGSIGVEVDLFDVIEVSVQLDCKLELSGKNLKAAFVDATKQLVALELEQHEVPKKLDELAQLAMKDPDVKEILFAAVPVAGTWAAAKRMAVTKWPEEIVRANADYATFFQNNPDTGFDASVGLSAELEAGDKQLAGSFKPEVRAGVEDVDDREAVPYTEMGVAVGVTAGATKVKVDVAGRTRGDDVVASVGLRVDLAVSTKLAETAKLKSMAADTALISGLVSALGQGVAAAQGGPVSGLSALVNSAVNLAAGAGLAPTDMLTSKVGFEVGLEITNGQWSKVSGTIRLFTEVAGKGKLGGAGAEAKTRFGTVVEIGAELRAALPATIAQESAPSIHEAVGPDVTRFGLALRILQAKGLWLITMSPEQTGLLAVKAGILKNKPDLRLGEPVNRAEAAVMVNRAMGVPELDPGEVRRAFSDLSPFHWAGKSVYGAVTCGVLRGVGNDEFAPGNPMRLEWVDAFIDKAKKAGQAGLPPVGKGSGPFDPRVEWGQRSSLEGGKQDQRNHTKSLDVSASPNRDAGGSEKERAAESNKVADFLDASGSSRYTPEKDEKGNIKTYCNVFAHDFAWLMGAFVPRVWWMSWALKQFESEGTFPQPVWDHSVRELNANALEAWFHDFGHLFGWGHVGTTDPGGLTEAQALANQGRVVIIVGDTSSGWSGHITAVIPETGTVGASRDEQGNVLIPVQSQAGAAPETRGNGSNWYADTTLYRGGLAVWAHG